MPAMFEHAYGVASQQEVPHHFTVFASEFGESVRNHHRTAEYARCAVFTQCVEFVRVVAVVMQPSRMFQLRQHIAIPINGGRFHPAFRHAVTQRRQYCFVHFGVVTRLIDERDSHEFHLRRTKPKQNQSQACALYNAVLTVRHALYRHPARHPRILWKHEMCFTADGGDVVSHQHTSICVCSHSR